MISAVILTKNEEKNIQECLKSIDFCDEVVVVDDNSIDKTSYLCKKFGAKVFVREMKKDVSAQLNFGMSKAKGDWILFLDADERVSPELRQEILGAVSKDSGIKGYVFKRHDFLWGKWLRHGEIGSFRSLRLVKRGSGKWERRVHQKFMISGRISEFKNPLLHIPHKSLKKFVESIDRWSSWHALANYEEGKQASFLRIIFFPLLHFIRNYVFRMGFLDGIQGFVLAVVMSFHSYLSWSKLWIYQKKSTIR